MASLFSFMHIPLADIPAWLACLIVGIGVGLYEVLSLGFAILLDRWTKE